MYEAMGEAAEAEDLFRQAHQLRRKIVPGDRRQVSELKECDYDKLVIFWSR
jgi:hypothetical protein